MRLNYKQSTGLEMEDEFLDMMNQYRGILLKVCRLYENDPESRQDLFQEITLQLWRSYPKLQGNASLSTWVYRVALNTAITIFRKSSKKPQTVRLDSGLAIEVFHDESGENVQQLNRAIEQLNKIEKGLILLYLDEKSYQEMAEITGFTASNIGVKINRIKKKLSNILNQK